MGNYLHYSLIANKAAIEIDMHLRGVSKTSDYNGVREVADILRNLVTDSTPISIGLLSRVFFSSAEQMKGTQMDELKRIAKDFANELEMFKEFDTSTQKELRQKCIRLSQAYQA